MATKTDAPTDPFAGGDTPPKPTPAQNRAANPDVGFRYTGTDRVFLGTFAGHDGASVELVIGSVDDAERPKGIPDNVVIYPPNGTFDGMAWKALVATKTGRKVIDQLRKSHALFTTPSDA